MKPRPYQTELIRLWIDSLKNGHRRPLIFLPTGGGKTVIASNIINGVNNRGKRALFIVDREPLIDQTINKFRAIGIEPGVIKAGYKPDLNQPIQVGSIQTISRRKIYPDADLIIIDECHGSMAKSYDAIFERYQDKIITGLTATPFRLKKQKETLAHRFDCIVGTVQSKDLVEMGWLSPIRLFGPSADYLDLSKVHTQAGDFKANELSIACDQPSIIKDAIQWYKNKANDKRTICFTIDTAHSRHVCELFNASGVKTEIITGDTPPKERKALYHRLHNKETLMLVSVGVLAVGFDLPSVECMIDLRPTKSKCLYLQRIGRILRISPDTGKTEAILLDLAGNFWRHGHPLEPIPLTLNPVDEFNKGGKGETPIKCCPECGHHEMISIMECSSCGYLWPKKEKLSEVGELEEITQDAVMAGRLHVWVTEMKRKNYKKAWVYYRFLDEYPSPTLAQLQALAKVLAYKPQWAYMQWKTLGDLKSA